MGGTSKAEEGSAPIPMKKESGGSLLEYTSSRKAYGATGVKGSAGSVVDTTQTSFCGVPAICVCILVVELCERLAFYTFTGTQEFYLEKNGYSLSEAGGLNAAMSTLCMAWALVIGWIADVWLGRYKTIVIFGLVYAFGAAVSTMAAWPGLGNPRMYLIGVMVFVPMGTAGIKANISNFGADQYDVSIPSQKEAQEKFFNWFYLAINLGSAVAYGYLTTMGSNGGLGVPKEYGYFAVYLIASVCMLGAVGIFVSGREHYRIQPVLRRSPLDSILNHVVSATKKGSSKGFAMCFGSILLMLSIVFSVAEALQPESPWAHYLVGAAFAAAALGSVNLIGSAVDTSWIESQELEGEEVTADDVGAFLRLLPTLILGNLCFGALYNSMQYWYQQQACQMDLRITGNQQFAGSFFMIADCLGIVVATPIALGYLNPFLDRTLGGRFGHGTKFGVGMTFAVMSVLMSANLEVTRRSAAVLDIVSNCAPEGVKMSETGAVWMFLPFLLMGIGEIYTQPVLMHWAYSNSPPAMRTLAAVVTLLIGAVSNALFTVQIAALGPYVPNNLNDGHLEYGYYMNVALGMVLYGGFLSALGRFERHGTAASIA